MLGLAPIFADTAVPSVVAATKTPYDIYYNTVVVQLPAVKSVGDLLVVLIDRKYEERGAQGGFSWPAGWTPLFANGEIQSDQTNKIDIVAIAYHVVTPSTGNYISVATNDWYGNVTGAVCIHVKDWHGVTPPEYGSYYNQFSHVADPPNLAPSWGNAQTLWLVAMIELDISVGPTAPAGYGGLDWQVVLVGKGGEESLMAWAYKMQETASENPGAFGNIQGTSIAFTIAVRPPT